MIDWLTTYPDEAAGAIFGLLGAYLLAGKGKGAPWGWLAFLASNFALLSFAWRAGHPGLFALQIGFTCTSSRGIWIWLVQPNLYWDEWRGDLDGTNVVMHIRCLARWRSRAINHPGVSNTGNAAEATAIAGNRDWRLDLHQMVAPDSPGCYHTHPAKAWRLVLWAGYVEELEDGTRVQWWPGRMGFVRPELSHRIASLPRGRSYSLWLRWPKTHKIELRGHGWSAPARFTGIPAEPMMRDLLAEIERKHGHG